MGKTLWSSKTFWVNVIALVAMIVQSFTGEAISAESQVMILTVVNTLLRFLTKEPIDWKKNSKKNR